MADDTKGKKSTEPTITHEDLERLEKLEGFLQQNADESEEAGRAYMTAVFNDLLAMVMRKETTLRNRFKREELAGRRKRQKALKTPPAHAEEVSAPEA